jgi:metallo-beta-lactamase class B
MNLRVLLLPLLAVGLFGQERPSSCASCPAWNQPQQPFRIYGNSYYVGTRGLGSVLITSPGGHVLIDGALPESAPRIAASIRSLGFRLEDIKLIVNSHAHFDHAGGIAELQKLSGARVAASPWAADVMKKGAVARDDPQYGTIIPIARVARVETVKDGEALRAGAIAITAHFTPGHTPGGTSWTWRACENGHCLNMVYADSLTPISSDGFLFSRRKEYSNGTADFERSFAFLDRTPCDILITPHPDLASLQQRPERNKPTACQALATTARERLKKRLASERGQ